MSDRLHIKLLLILFLVVSQWFTLAHAIDHQGDDEKIHCAVCSLNDHFQSSITPVPQQVLAQKNYYHNHDLYIPEFTGHAALTYLIRAPPYTP